MTVKTMLNAVNHQDLARMHAKFVLPIVVDSMLRDEEILDDEAEYAMNEILFELCPDTALLCLAMCARHIAGAAAHLPVGLALRHESEKIIGEYGPVWLANESNPAALDSRAVRDLLSFIPEDFEGLRDLLDATAESLEEDHCIAAILCDILSFQAAHHASMAEIELQSLNIEPKTRPSLEKTAGRHDNVIPFRPRF